MLRIDSSLIDLIFHHYSAKNVTHYNDGAASEIDLCSFMNSEFSNGDISESGLTRSRIDSEIGHRSSDPGSSMQMNISRENYAHPSQQHSFPGEQYSIIFTLAKTHIYYNQKNFSDR